MEEETTTPAATDTGVEQTQPVDVAPTEAVTDDTSVTTEQQDAPEATQEPSNEDDTSEWLKKKGIDPGDPEAVQKLAKMNREAEKAFHSKAQKASELERTLSTTSDDVAEVIAEERNITDPVVIELLKDSQRRNIKDSTRDFWESNPDARAYESKMVELVQAKPHLAGDLDALYATAVMQSGKLNEVKSQGGREALQTLAHKQTAAVPKGNATTTGTSPKEKPFSELTRAEMRARLGVHKR